jgi:uncharacterized integral membrane protein
MRIFKVYLYGLLVLLFVVFIIQNFQTLTQGISLRFNLGFISLISIPIPLYLVAAVLFFGGVLLTSLIHWAEKRPLVKEIKILKRNTAPASPAAGPDSVSPKGAGPAEAAARKTEADEKKSEGGTIVSSKPLIRKDPSGGDKPSLSS